VYTCDSINMGTVAMTDPGSYNGVELTIQLWDPGSVESRAMCSGQLVLHRPRSKTGLRAYK